MQTILEWIASGATILDVIASYPKLQPEDVEQAVRYAARFLENEILISSEIPA